MITTATECLRIAVADDEPEMLEYFQHTLSALGHEAVSKAVTGEELVDHCRELKPDLVITDIAMPGMDGLQAATAIRQNHPIPIIIVSAHHESETIKRALQDHVLAYLVKPINKANLEIAITLALQRFKEFRALQQQADELHQALEDREVVEKAKGILMSRAGYDEPTAFRRLQLLSSTKNRKMIEIARMIVTAEEALQV